MKSFKTNQHPGEQKPRMTGQRKPRSGKMVCSHSLSYVATIIQEMKINAYVKRRGIRGRVCVNVWYRISHLPLGNRKVDVTRRRRSKADEKY